MGWDDAGDLNSSSWGLKSRGHHECSGQLLVSPSSPSQKLLHTGGRSSICRDKSAHFPPAHPLSWAQQRWKPSPFLTLVSSAGGHHAGLHPPPPSAAQLPHPGPGVLIPRGSVPGAGPAPHPQRCIPAAAAGARLTHLPTERGGQTVSSGTSPGGLVPLWAHMDPQVAQGKSGGCPWLSGTVVKGCTSWSLALLSQAWCCGDSLPTQPNSFLIWASFPWGGASCHPCCPRDLL